MTRKRTKLYERQHRHSEDPLKPANDQKLSMNKDLGEHDARFIYILSNVA